MTGDSDAERISAILRSVPTPPDVSVVPVGPLNLPAPVPNLGPPSGGRRAENAPQAADETRDDGDDPRGSPPEDAGSRQSGSSTTSGEPVSEAARVGEEYLDRVERAIEAEDCQYCEAILERLRSMPVEEQIQGVQELAELKRAMARDADEEEVGDLMDDFEVLDDPQLLL